MDEGVKPILVSNMCKHVLMVAGVMVGPDRTAVIDKAEWDNWLDADSEHAQIATLHLMVKPQPEHEWDI